MTFRAKPPKTPPPGTLAGSADRHRCYELSVQDPVAEIDMVDTTYRELRGKSATVLREDFCGTANTSCEWIKRRPDNRAVSIDIDPEVLEWARANNVAGLRPSQRERIDIRRSDVMDFRGCKADIILAMNFSYQLFKTRSQLAAYFATARDELADDGVLFIDAYGGYESCRRSREKTRLEQFTYYWEQAKFDPMSGHMLCYIHFRFDDKSWLKRAFSYCWRLYTLPELREILDEAGFSRTIVYWEGIDEATGEGNGIFTPAEHGQDDPAWIVYISAEK